MAVSTQGTAHLFGIQAGVAVVTSATVLSLSFNNQHQNTAQTQNEIGNEIERRYDDLHEDGTLTIRPQSGFVALTVGGTYAYDGTTFEVVSEGVEEQNAGFMSYSYAIKKSEYISYA